MRGTRKIMIAVATVMAAVSVVTPPASATAYQYRGHHGLSNSAMVSAVPLRSSGLRPVAFSVGLQSSQDRYSMFWDNKPGPDWKLDAGGKGADAYQRLFDRFTAAGYQPVQVTATGNGANAIFTGIWEKKSGNFVARHGIALSQFDALNDTAKRTGYIPISVNLYGTMDVPRVVAIWAPKPAGVKWDYSIAYDAGHQQRVFDRYVGNGYRPSAIAVSPNGAAYLTIWRKDNIGTWYAYHNMTAAQYQKRFDEMTAKGLYPVWIDMENGVYAAIFTAR